MILKALTLLAALTAFLMSWKAVRRWRKDYERWQDELSQIEFELGFDEPIGYVISDHGAYYAVDAVKAFKRGSTLTGWGMSYVAVKKFYKDSDDGGAFALRQTEELVEKLEEK